MKLRYSLLNLFLIIFLSGCTTAPYTNRSQMIITSENEEMSMGQQLFNQVKQESQVETNPLFVNPLQRVGGHIADAANDKSYNWEFTVLKSDDINAFCLPGGKVVVYTGLFPFIDNDAELACVLSHEIGHAIARHGGENISRQYMQQLGAIALSSAISSSANYELWMGAYGLGSNLGVMLPFSREQEYEADQIGLILMAKAGYDPKASLTFWNKFKNLQSYGPLEEFFATHPMGEKRLEEIKALMPEVMQIYTLATPKYGLGQPISIKANPSANAPAQTKSQNSSSAYKGTAKPVKTQKKTTNQ